MVMFKQVDLYPVISSEFTNGRDVIDVLLQIAAGGAKIVQLREKNISKAEIFRLALRYREITTENDMLLILNDHLDIALAVDADGVHLGQDDLPLVVARKLAPQLILGSSTHNLSEAEQAIADGADYINIGPIYSTETKQLSYDSLGLEIMVKVADEINIPFTVMGGIKEEHLDKLIHHGAQHIAMVTEITQADDITNRVKQLRKLLQFRPEAKWHVVASQVIGCDTTGWFRSMIINKGRKDGIRINMPVINAEGLVGKIIAVSGNYSKVLLITDPNSAIDCLDQKTRTRGILKGMSNNGCALDYIGHSQEIRPGDPVVTSGLAGIFPKGIPVGRVKEVREVPGALFKRVEIVPFVDFSRLEEVLVILRKGSYFTE